MLREFLHSKIHRATVTDANLNYVGSITIDEEFLELAKRYSVSGDPYGKTLKLENGQIKFVRGRVLYEGSQKYIVTISDITNMRYND